MMNYQMSIERSGKVSVDWKGVLRTIRARSKSTTMAPPMDWPLDMSVANNAIVDSVILRVWHMCLEPCPIADFVMRQSNRYWEAGISDHRLAEFAACRDVLVWRGGK